MKNLIVLSTLVLGLSCAAFGKQYRNEQVNVKLSASTSYYETTISLEDPPFPEPGNPYPPSLSAAAQVKIDPPFPEPGNPYPPSVSASGQVRFDPPFPEPGNPYPPSR